MNGVECFFFSEAMEDNLLIMLARMSGVGQRNNHNSVRYVYHTTSLLAAVTFARIKTPAGSRDSPTQVSLGQAPVWLSQQNLQSRMDWGVRLFSLAHRIISRSRLVFWARTSWVLCV